MATKYVPMELLICVDTRRELHAEERYIVYDELALGTETPNCR